MSSKVEERLKIIAEYLKSLSIISYEDIIDMLNDKNNHYQIEFNDQFDVLNNIHYSCVSILKNNDTSSVKKYLSADQDVKKIYTNLIAALQEKKAEASFEIFTNYFGYNQLACCVGENVLILSKEIVAELMAESSDFFNKRSNDIQCIIGNKEIFLPSSLSNTGIKKEKIIGTK